MSLVAPLAWSHPQSRHRILEMLFLPSGQYSLIEYVGLIGNGLPIRWFEMKKGGVKMPLKSGGRGF
jgi:hypothetical protein